MSPSKKIAPSDPNYYQLLNTTQKNEYNITVLRGPSISELILAPEEIDYTGIEKKFKGKTLETALDLLRKVELGS